MSEQDEKMRAELPRDLLVAIGIDHVGGEINDMLRSKIAELRNEKKGG